MKILIEQEVPEGAFCKDCSSVDRADKHCLVFNSYLSSYIQSGKKRFKKCDKCLNAPVSSN